jgi:hypothetical protein
LVHGVLPESGLAAIYGHSGAAKTFLYLDLMAALAEGGDWFGYSLPGGLRIVLVVLEGEGGFRNRVEAWERDRGRPFPDGVRFVFQGFNLLNTIDVLALAAAIEADGGADVVVVDTLNRAAPGAEENSSRDMGHILERSKELQGCFGGLLIFVHHLGKDTTKGMRGHSSLLAALDAAIEATRAGDRREWSVAKSKDGQDGNSHGFRLESVQLGTDDDGKPITSCVVRSDDVAVGRKRKSPAGDNQKIVFRALPQVFAESFHLGKAGAPASRACIQIDELVDKVRDKLPVQEGRRTERAKQAIKSLVASGHLCCNENWVWFA